MNICEKLRLMTRDLQKNSTQFENRLLKYERIFYNSRNRTPKLKKVTQQFQIQINKIQNCNVSF